MGIMEHTEPYRVELTDVFEGPMDLLVYLIKKNEVDIYDIPIAMITDQYLGYIDLMKSLNIDLAGEFLVMAATLAQIKSKMLLPIHDGIEEDAEDPRLAITRPLIEYLQLKSAAEELAARQLLGEHTFIRKADTQEFIVDPDEEVIKIGLFELIDAFKRILDKVDPDQRVDLTADSISVKDRITQLIDILEEKGSIAFEELFDSDTTKADIIVTFLAVLEMVKVRLVRMVQYVKSGIIRLFYL